MARSQHQHHQHRQHQSRATAAATTAQPKPPGNEPQPTEARDDALLLHLVRILAVYLALCLSRSASLALDDLAALAGEPPHPRASVAEEETEQLLDALLVAWVERETASNQFDGLLSEHRASLVVKKFFRQHGRVPPLRVLAGLLGKYLSQLRAPLVLCESTAMLRSTLEYLLTTGKILQTVSPALLYPLVNAVDSLRTEQRDCLEALTALLQRLAEHCDASSQALVAKFVGCHHRRIIHIASDQAGESARSKPSRTDAPPKDLAHLQALGSCFVRTLLCHCDHIFRRDPEFVDAPALLDSETEDEDFSEHSPAVSPAGATRKELEQGESAPIASAVPRPAITPTDSTLSSAETEDADDECHESATPALPAPAETRHSGKSSASRSTRRRKKRELRVAAAAGDAHLGTSRVVAPDVTCSAAALADMDADESYATMAIAAAAGTLAAVLCVIFT